MNTPTDNPQTSPLPDQPAWHQSRAIQYALWVAAFGLVANVIALYFESIQNVKVEKAKLQQQLIINAARGANVDVVKKNLMFLIDTGLLHDSEMVDSSRIRDYIQSQNPMILDTTRNCALRHDGRIVCWGSDGTVTYFDTGGLAQPGD